MSAKLMGMVFEIELGRDEFPVMIALADHAQDDGTSVYPSIAYLAWKTNLSERSVQRILRKLEDRGLVEVVGNHQGGRGQAREYVLHLSKGVKKPPFIRRDTPPKGRQYDTVPSPVNDDNVTPFTAVKGDTTTPFAGGSETQKGDTGDIKRVTPVTQKGDTGVTPTVREPSVKPSGDINAPQAARVDGDNTDSWHRQMFTAIYEACTCQKYQRGQPVATRYRAKINAAIKDLPDAQPHEVAVRAAEYRLHYPGIKLTPNALANHWDELIPSARPGSTKRSSLDVVENYIAGIGRNGARRDHRHGVDVAREAPHRERPQGLDHGLLELPDPRTGGDD